MNPITAALVAGALVVGGKWAQGKTPNMQNAVGIGGIAIGLSFLDTANERLANLFGWLIVLGVAMVYFPRIVKGTGLADFA